MADFTVTGNWYIYPTFGTLGAGSAAQPYKGSYNSELQLAALLIGLAGSAFVFSGFTVPGSSADLTLSVAAGVAMVSGRMITTANPVTVTCFASNTNYIFLKLLKDAYGYVIGSAYEVNVTGVQPADSVPVAIATTTGSAVSLALDARPSALPNGPMNRMVVLSAAGAQTFVPKFLGLHQIILIGGGGGGGAGAGLITTTTNYASGGGGGAGAWVMGSLSLDPKVPITATVGAAGTAGSGSGGGPQLAAGPGGASIFGSLSANGGGAAGSNGNTTGGAAGTGGAAATITSVLMSLAGGNGVAGSNAAGATLLAGGRGGQAPWYPFLGPFGSVAVSGGVPPSTVLNAVNPGAGGAGGIGWYNSPNGTGVTAYTPGGSGAPGLIIISY